MFLVLIAFIFGVSLVVGGYLAVTKLPGLLAQRQLEGRLKDLSAPLEEPEDPKTGKRTLVKIRQDGPMPAFDRVMAGSARGSALTKWLEQTGVKATPSAILLIAAVLGALVALLAGMLAHNTWAMVAGGAVGFALPFIVLKSKRTRRMRKFEEEFPEALDLISRALKAGHAFATGLKMAADELSEPVGPEFRKTFDEQNFGLPLKDALENLTMRVPSLDVRFFATAVLIQRETGGNLSEILENLAHVVRERFKILRQVRVYTAHGRMTGYVLLALPAVLVVALSFINPDHMNLLFRERMGQMLLLTAIGMQTVGFFWIKQVVKIEV
jgi:tight adherence protein B